MMTIHEEYIIRTASKNQNERKHGCVFRMNLLFMTLVLCTVIIIETHIVYSASLCVCAPLYIQTSPLYITDTQTDNTDILE